MTAEGPEPPGTATETHLPDEAAERLAQPADASAGLAGDTGPAGGAGAADPADFVARGMGYLDQAIDAFSRGCESADGDIVPLAVELLARTLPLRGRDADAALVWQRGLEDPDPAVEAAVRTRLRRAFGGDEVTADGDAAEEPAWWEGFVEAAVCYGTLPLLANELFGALDQMYSLAALPLAQGGAGPAICGRSCSAPSGCPASTPGDPSCTRASAPACATPWAPPPTSSRPTGPINSVGPGAVLARGGDPRTPRMRSAPRCGARRQHRPLTGHKARFAGPVTSVPP